MMTVCHNSRTSHRNGFTLLEMLLSMVILAFVIAAIAYVMSVMQNIWVQLRGKADGYRTTRIALDTVAGRLAQATLNTRTNYNTDDAQANPSSPLSYVSESDLHFVTGSAHDLLPDNPKAVGRAVFFQAPFGKDATAKDSVGANTKNQEDMRKLNSTLNAWGYFVEYGADASEKPLFMKNDLEHFPERKRFRLLEFRQPAGELGIFDLDKGPPPQLKINKAKNADDLYAWFRAPLKSGDTYTKRHLTVIAENVVAFALTPLDPKERAANSDLSTSAPFSSAPSSNWNSRGHQIDPQTKPEQRHQLPPALQLTAIAISEDTWLRFSDNYEDVQKMDRLQSELQTMVNARFSSGEKLAADIKALSDFLEDTKQHPYVTINSRIVTILIPLAGQ